MLQPGWGNLLLEGTWCRLKDEAVQMTATTHDKEAAAGLALSVQPSMTHHWQADAWEDQNAATSADIDAPAGIATKHKRGMDSAPHLPEHFEQQPQPKAQKMVEVKQIKEEATTFPHGLFGLSDAHFQLGDDIAHIHQGGDIFGRELSQGDDIADKRLQQLVQAHSKVSQLQAQLAAARQQCAQLQTESNSVPIDQGLAHAPADEWGSEDCSTADASRVAMPAASQSRSRGAQPLQQVPDNIAHTHRPPLKDEPVMLLHASKSAGNDGAWALLDTAPAGGAESALSSGEVPVRADTEPDEAHTKPMHPDEDSDPRLSQAMQQELQGTKDVTALATLLSMTYQGKVVNLNHRVMQAPVSSSPGSAAWRSVPFWPVRVPVRGDAGEEGFCLRSSSPQHVLCTVSGARTQIASGELRMAPETALVFDGSCAGVVVSNMAFYGGVVVCHGSGCSVSFEDTKFARCSVVALAGAQVSLTTSDFQNAQRGVAICASGADTVVRMHGGSVKYGAQGALVRGGARLEASSATLTRCADVGVECEGARSSVKLVDCDMHEFPHQKGDCGNVATGVRVRHHSAAHLAALTLSGLCHGVAVQDGATASISECRVTNITQSCITFEGAACGTVSGCTLARSQKVCGLCVCGPSTQVTVSKCSFSEHAYSGVVVLKGASLTADSCATSQNKYEGFYVHDKGSAMTLKDCSSERDLRGCGVQGEGATLTVQGGTVSDSVSDGVAAWSSGAAVITDCTVTNCRKDGVLVKGCGSRIEMQRCRVSGTLQHCAAAKAGGFLRAQACTLSESASGCGIRASGKGTDVEVEDCTLQGNAVHAALASEEASVDVSACRSVGHRKEGFMVWSRAQLSVTDSTSEGDAGVGGVDDEGVLCMEGIKAHMEGQKRARKPEVAADAPEGTDGKD